MRPILRRRIATVANFFLWLTASAGCYQPQLPAHEVDVWSDCSGADLLGRYGFPEHNFEMVGCDDWFGPGCSAPAPLPGAYVSGDHVVRSIEITGVPDIAYFTYLLYFDPPAEQLAANPEYPIIYCIFYRDEVGDLGIEFGKKKDCVLSDAGCQAMIELRFD